MYAVTMSLLLEIRCDFFCFTLPQKESGKKAMKKVTDASEEVTEK